MNNENFKLLSRFNPDANFTSVRIGSDSPVLEVELNELQDIADFRYKQLVNNYIGDGITNTGTYVFTNGNLSIINESAIINGNMIDITNLSVDLKEGESAYIEVWVEDVTYTSKIKLKGNYQEERYVENTILDSRVGEETSRRRQLMYNLVNTKPLHNKSLLVGTVVDGEFKIEADLKSQQGNTYTHVITGKEGQQLCNLPRPYKMYANALIVFVDGVVQVPGKDYMEVNSTTFKFNKALDDGADVVIIVTPAPKIVDTGANTFSGGQHAISHSKEGSDPLDLADLNDREQILPRLQGVLDTYILDGGALVDDPSQPDTIVDGGYF